VPVRLLTKEAFGHYFRHLKSDGVLALHITNRFLNLKLVVKSAADAFAQDVNAKDIEAPKNFKLWKDDYSSLISILN